MRTFILAVTGFVLSVAACSSYGTSVVEVKKTRAAVASVSLSIPRSLVAGQTARAVATIKDATGATLGDRALVWYTSSASIASVTDSGMVSAVAPGNAVLSAVSEGVAGQATMAVIAPPPTPAPVATVLVAITPASVLIGQKAHATATLEDSTGNPLVGRTVSWQSSNSSIASVASTGDVSAVGVGTANITASSEGQTGLAALTVVVPPPIPVASVSASPATATLQIGGTVQLGAVTRDANNNVLTGRTIIWSSANSSIAAVSALGLVTAIASGGVQVTASSEGQMASSAITVSAPIPPPPVAVASVSVSPATATLQIGGTTQLAAVTRDASNNVLTGRVITWSSNNTSIATVSAAGLVSAVTAGSAQITATSEGKTGSAAITVSAPAPAPVASVSVTPAAPSLQVGASVQLTATTKDAAGNVLTGRVVTWSSSNPSVASVNSSGLVPAVAVGSATITATSETKIGTSAITVTAPGGGGSGWRGQEPTGMNFLTERPFDTQPEDGWGLAAASGSVSNFSIVTDALGPQSPSNVARMRYPVGFASGGEPAKTWKDVTNYRHLYWCMAFKISNPWAGDASLTNKIVHFFVNDQAGAGNHIFSVARGSGNNPLYAQFGLQGLAANYNAVAQGGEGVGAASWLVANQPGGQAASQIVRGQWIVWEAYFDAGTPGNADGSVQWWVNGVLVGSYTGIPFVPAGGNARWESIGWNPTWGGSSGTISVEQYQYMDHFYASGKN